MSLKMSEGEIEENRGETAKRELVPAGGGKEDRRGRQKREDTLVLKWLVTYLHFHFHPFPQTNPMVPLMF